MELDLKSGEGGLTIRWNGALVTEVGPTGPVRTKEYERDVRRGRVAFSLAVFLEGVVRRSGSIDLMPDHVNSRPNERRAAYLRGFADGARGRTKPHPSPGVPPMTPEHSPSYTTGYSDGEIVGLCIRKIKEEEG